MRWGRKGDTGLLVEPPPEPMATYWTGRLAGVGAQLDRQGAPLSGLALSCTGEQSAVSVLAYGSSMYHQRWSPIDFNVSGLPPAPDADLRPGEWERRLGAVGQVLDDNRRAISDPCVVETEGGFLVTALAGTDGRRELMTWPLVTEETAR